MININPTEQFSDLINLIQMLRGPDGCPWDKEQTHESLKSNLIEESYETLNAIDKNDQQNLLEELGDVLLQILFHSDIAEKNNQFTINDVIYNLQKKLIDRHPHVFSIKTSLSSNEVVSQWEEIKKQSLSSKNSNSSLDSITPNLPGLLYATKIQKKAASYGLDWTEIDGVIEKLYEEILEFRKANTKTSQKEELGDIFFTLVNFARWINIDSEIALQESTAKFIQRFKRIENYCIESKIKFDKLSFEQKEELWEKSKSTKI
tara:strand:+ start:631 stop:1416 length:786 start_codon:yes stop_codon:yes gene_type:complete